MNSQNNRENTFRVDFSNLPKKPSVKEVHQFLARDLGLPREKTKRVQINHVQNCVFVKTADLETAEQIVEEHDGKHVREVNKKKYTIRILMEDGCTNVKLHDLTEDVSDQQISRYMSQYGEVVSVTELMWGEDLDYHGISSGTRSVRMLLKHPIKSYVTIQGQCAYVKYAGQQATCRHCGEYVHIGIPCVQNKKLLVQKVSVNERLKPGAKESFASVLKTGQANTRQEENKSSNDEEERDPAAMSQDDDDEEADYTLVDYGSGRGKRPKLPRQAKLKNVPKPLAKPSTGQGLGKEVAGELPQGTLVEQQTVIQEGNKDVLVFKTPLLPPGKHRLNDDGNETDASTASTSSNGKRRPGRPRKTVSNDPEAPPQTSLGSDEVMEA